jgi:hypothetical protein
MYVCMYVCMPFHECFFAKYRSLRMIFGCHAHVCMCAYTYVCHTKKEWNTTTKRRQTDRQTDMAPVNVSKQQPDRVLYPTVFARPPATRYKMLPASEPALRACCRSVYVSSLRVTYVCTCVCVRSLALRACCRSVYVNTDMCIFVCTFVESQRT